MERVPTGNSGRAAGNKLPAKSNNGSSSLCGCRGRAINGSVLPGRGADASSEETPVCNCPTTLFIKHVPICCQKEAIRRDLEKPVRSPATLRVRRSRNVFVIGPVPPQGWNATGWNTHPADAHRVEYLLILDSSFRWRYFLASSMSRVWDGLRGWEMVRSMARGRESNPSKAMSAGLSLFPMVTSVAHGKVFSRRKLAKVSRSSLCRLVMRDEEQHNQWSPKASAASPHRVQVVSGCGAHTGNPNHHLAANWNSVPVKTLGMPLFDTQLSHEAVW